jgi:predicted transport protein
MNELISFGNNRSYDDFKKNIPIMVQPLFDSIREYCLSLGENTVEDIRMHRVVFGKSMTFRWFADVAPKEHSVIIKIQKNRKEPIQNLEVDTNQDLDELKKILKEAFETIR